MATVYLAEDVRHARCVAVKVLRPELAAVLGADRFLEMLALRVGSDLEVVERTALFDASSYGRILPGPGDTVFFATRDVPRPEGGSTRARPQLEPRAPRPGGGARG